MDAAEQSTAVTAAVWGKAWQLAWAVVHLCSSSTTLHVEELTTRYARYYDLDSVVSFCRYSNKWQTEE